MRKSCSACYPIIRLSIYPSRRAAETDEGVVAGGTFDIGAEALCSVQLRPSQLTVLSDGVTLGFELPGKGVSK